MPTKLYRVEATIVAYVEATNHRAAEQLFDKALEQTDRDGVCVSSIHGPVVDSILSADSVPSDEADSLIYWDGESTTVGEVLRWMA